MLDACVKSQKMPETVAFSAHYHRFLSAIRTFGRRIMLSVVLK